MEYIENNNNGIVLYGQNIKNKEDLYVIPLRSSNLDIYKCSLHFDHYNYYSINDLKCKLFAVPLSSTEYSFFPILHTFSK